MRFADQTQREAFVRACKGDWHVRPLLPEPLRQASERAARLHNQRGSVAGCGVDPLALRAKWAPASDCEHTPERKALAAIAGTAPTCKCRLCRLREATSRYKRLSLGTSEPWTWGDIWAHLPEACIADRRATVRGWEWADTERIHL